MDNQELLITKLREAGAIGLDGSPGDPLAKQAAEEIIRLQAENTKLKWELHVCNEDWNRT